MSPTSRSRPVDRCCHLARRPVNVRPPYVVIVVVGIVVLSTTTAAAATTNRFDTNSATKCDWEELEEAIESIKQCNPLLAEISSQVLRTSHIMQAQKNYSHVCSSFEGYVQCMLPAFMCPAILKGFWINYDKYVGPPYRCRVNTVMRMHHGVTVTTRASSTSSAMAAAVPRRQSLTIAAVVCATCLSLCLARR